MFPVKIENHLYRIPSRSVQGNSTHIFREYEYIITKTTFNNGIEGIGYTYTQGNGGTAIIRLLEDYFCKSVINDKITAPIELRKKIWDYTYAFGLEGLSRLAYAALDTSFYDAAAKERGVPLYMYLGGNEDARIRTYRSAIDLNMSMKELTDDIRKFKNQNYSVFKIKVGKGNFKEDIERIDAVREIIGDESKLMVDANRRWSTKEAIKNGKELQKRDVFWLEEPIESDLLEDYSFLRNKLDILVAAGESLYNGFEMEHFLKMRCADISQIDVLRAGGIYEWMRLANLANSFGMNVAPHFTEEIAIQVLCATPNALFLEHLPGSNLRDSGLMKEPFEIKDGYAYPRKEPGNGIDFKWEKLEKYMVL
jgi:L-alanine-DL-glutamate epimerase-like enolase superfamily enzyme